MQYVETGVFKISSRTFLVLNRKLTIAVTIITERTHNFSFAEITTVHDYGGWLKHCVCFFSSAMGCPYSEINMKKDSVLPDRLSGEMPGSGVGRLQRAELNPHTPARSPE